MITPADWFAFPTGKIPVGQYCECCGRYNARHITCSVMVISNSGEVLLTKRVRDPQAGWWCMPGGYVEWGETLEECAVRELREEVGMGVTTDACTLFDLASDPGRDADGRQNIDCCYVVEVDEAVIKPNQEEVMEWGWFALSELPVEVAFDHRQRIDKYASRA